MKYSHFTVENDGFYGVYYPAKTNLNIALILMLGDSPNDRLSKTGVKYLHAFNCNVLAMSPAQKDYGHHSYPLERFGYAINELKRRGNSKIGVIGASTTGMMALLVAIYYNEDISLTIALTPPDFVMEGFYQDGKDGRKERPGDYESSVTWEGKPLPFLPYAYRHPEYWDRVMRESKASGNIVCSKFLFDNSEASHPIEESERLKVEKIKGKLVFVGAEDDALWNTTKYIKRMKVILDNKPHESNATYLLYKHGTHFVFPYSFLKKFVPIFSSLLLRICFKAAREYPKECKETQKDIDVKLKGIINEWIKN